MDFDLEGCVGGDERAWAAFVARAAPVIHAAVARTLGMHRARENTADVVQEVFVRLLRDDRRPLRSFDAARASLATWLTVVARSAAIDHLRRHRRSAAVSLDEAATVPAGDAPVEPAAPAMAALPIPPDLLTGRQRLVLHLIFDKQMDVGEAARFLGVDAQTVRSTRHKALERLRGFFGRDRP